jgi:imidazolonepropionase-like amidohydrolase
MKSLVVASLALLPCIAHCSDTIPGVRQNGPVALVGGTIHPVSGPPIEGGTLVFEAGKITAVGADVEIPSNAERIDLAGKHVYPALFESMSDLGLIEIGSVRATIDKDEAGDVNPNVKAWISVNPDSEVIPVTRSNGVLLALTAPTGGLVSGQAGVLQLDGWTYEDLTLKPTIRHTRRSTVCSRTPGRILRLEKPIPTPRATSATNRSPPC